TLFRSKPILEWDEVNLRRELGYVFQNPEHQFITHTVYDEVAYSLHLKEMTEQEINKKVNHILKICGLLHLKNEHPFSLSQGQKRRLSVATMIVDDEQILILDEPTFVKNTHSNYKLIESLLQRYESGPTTIMITH